MMTRSLILGAALAAIASSWTLAADPALYGGLKARSIGPAAMSGRVTAIEADPANPDRVYVGAASSGIWKSSNAGLTWTPIFERQPVHSIGALALNPNNPEDLWVGTGEANVRNSVSVGGGVWRTRDGGETWQFLGLGQSERIHRVVLHPTQPDTAWVAASGPLWSAGGERGIYKTVDGGQQWRRVLPTGPRTGGSDLVIDPNNPERLYATTWEHQRSAHRFESGGPGSGLWRSVDGGETWTRLDSAPGMPKGPLGRIAIAMAPAEPGWIYALVEAKDNVLLRSTDGGNRFEVMNKAVNVHPRPFYFADLRVDPTRPDRLYRLGVTADVSDDGGKSFATWIGWDDLHPDHHALWVHPRDGRILINGNDGGIGFSTDRGATWRYAANLPFAQFYHVTVDRQVPYRVYGGLQDNGSWRGPAEVRENGGIRNHHWVETNFGDGFDSAADPQNPQRGYAMSQQGYLVRFDLDTGERRFIRPAPPADGTELRFQWNAAFAQDPHDPATIWFGSQFVHRSRDRGQTWETLSGDLTSNDPALQTWKQSGGLTPDVTGAEIQTALIAIEPSPLERGVVWTGSDDGRVHVSRDDGQSWTRIDEAARGLPKHAYIPHIYASHHDAGRAFVVADAHRNGDLRPYAWRVDDYGRQWRALKLDGVSGWALKLLEDPVEPRLLWLGTEHGLWVSVDGGERFRQWTQGVPTASVMDLAVQPDEHDLVVATHGHGIYIVDDLRPLRALAREGTPKALVAWAGDGLLHTRAQPAGPRFAGNSEYIGENEPYGLPLSFWLDDATLPHPDARAERERLAAIATQVAGGGKPAEPKQLRIEVRDASGQLVRVATPEAKQGLNRWWWSLDSEAARSPTPPPPWGSAHGVDVLPGTYTFTVRYGEASTTATGEVRLDPRVSVSVEALAARRAVLLEAAALQDQVVDRIEEIRQLRADFARVQALAEARLAERQRQDPAAVIGDEDPLKTFLKALGESGKQLDAAEDRLWQDSSRIKGYQPDEDALSRLSVAEWALGSTWDAPAPDALGYLTVARSAVADALAKTRATLDAERAARAAEAAQLELTLFRAP